MNGTTKDASSAVYILQRGSEEADRLNAQHRVWTTNIGYHIHSSITPRLSAQSRIADIGTGTAVYLLDLAKSMNSSCKFHGFDIAADQYPSESELPPNVSLSVHDARVAFPEEHQGRYDFVHIRLLVAGLGIDDWKIVTHHALSLLKPGGAIQWEEGDYPTGRTFKGEPNSKIETIQRLAEIFLGKLNTGYSNLPTIFEESGLQGVVKEIVASDRVVETRSELTRINSLGQIGWARKAAAAGTGPWNEEEVDALEEKMEKERLSGAYKRFEINLFVGLKPYD